MIGKSMTIILCILLCLSFLFGSCSPMDKSIGGDETDTEDLSGYGRPHEGAGRKPSAHSADKSKDNTDTKTQTENNSSEEPDTDPGDGRAHLEGSEAEGNLKYVTFKGRTITDFSFLNGLSKDFMPDSGDAVNGSWFCGKTERDLSTGEVTYVWDRYPETLALLEKYGATYRKNEDRKVCYLTFDCGYENGFTDDILDILAEKNAPAAFFVNGQFIKTSSGLIRRMLDEGHIVGNHGNNHKVLAKLTIDEFLYEVESMNDLLQEYVPGAPYMEYFRPSYGSCSEWDLAFISELDLKNILYSWTYDDFRQDGQWPPEKALDAAKRGLHNGSVIMLHTVGETNVEILGDFIDYVRAEGFEIGHLSDD